MALDPLQENLLRRANVGDLIARSAARYRNQVAILYNNEPVTYAQLNERACRVANALTELGVKRGDRLSLMTHNCLQHFYIWFGACKIGAVMNPLNFMLKGSEIAYVINHAEPKLFLVEDSLTSRVNEVRDQLKSVEHFGWINFGAAPKPEGYFDADELFSQKYPATEPEVFVDSHDTAILMYTTGTEAQPKGVMTSHLNYFMSTMHLINDVGNSRQDVSLLSIPLFHVAGTVLGLVALTIGAKLVLQYAPNPQEILELTQREKVTYWVYPPTLYNALPMMPNFKDYDLSSLKKCISFGGGLPKVTLERWAAINPNLEWRNYYGQTESSPLGTTSIPETFNEKMESIGIPDLTATIRIVDSDGREVPVGEVGEIVMRSPAVMKGYFKDEAKTEETLRGGWLHTGDLGRMDEDGYFYFVDRIKDMIKSGGENVSSLEVEGVLMRHPKVAAAAVIGLPDEYWGEAVSAVIVPRPGQSVTPEEVIGFCKEQMAGYKVPKRVFIADSLPMTASGKVLKRQLREQYVGK